MKLMLLLNIILPLLGSSFPKAKPKQSLLTVFKLAISRFVFFPIYAKWWVEQTSPKIFTFLLLLYVLQMINWGIYSFNAHKVHESEVELQQCFI